MTQIIGLPKAYYEDTYKIVSRLNDKALEKLSKEVNVSLIDLQNFRDTKKLDAECAMDLYPKLFGNQTPLQVHNFLTNDLEGFVSFLNEDE